MEALLTTCLIVFGVFVVPLIIMFGLALDEERKAAKTEQFIQALQAFKRSLSQAGESQADLVFTPQLTNTNNIPQPDLHHERFGPLLMQCGGLTAKRKRLLSLCALFFFSALFGFQAIYTCKWLGLFDAHLLTPLAWCFFAVAVIFAVGGLWLLIRYLNLIYFYKHCLVVRRPVWQMEFIEYTSLAYHDIADISYAFLPQDVRPIFFIEMAPTFVVDVSLKNAKEIRFSSRMFGNSLISDLTKWMQHTRVHPLTS